MKDSIKSNLFMYIGITLGILVVILQVRSCRAVKTARNQGIELVNSLNDSVNYYKNEHKQTVATISVMETEKASDFLSLQTKEIQVKELQSIVKDYKNRLEKGSSVTLALLETINKSVQPTIIVKTDTIQIESNGYIDNFIYPTYRDTVKNEWIDYVGQMDKDSARLDLKIYNKFSAVVGKDRKGPFADITAYNPYTVVKTIRTYQVSQPKPKLFGFGLSTGITYDGKWKPYVGAGFNFNVIRF